MATDCEIRFRVNVKTGIEQTVGIVGNHELLGNWDEKKCYKLETSQQQFPIWESGHSLVFPKGTKLQFKFVILSPACILWEELPQNRKYRPRYCRVILTAEWNNQEGKEFVEKKFHSSICMTQDNIGKIQKKVISSNFDPFKQADDDSEDSIDAGMSFSTIKDSFHQQSDSEDEDNEVLPLKQISTNDFPSLYRNFVDNPKLRQLGSFNQNDILYEVNDDPMIEIQYQEELSIVTFYLPIILIVNDQGIQHNIAPSFSAHLESAVKELKCKRKWYGIPIIYDENNRRIPLTDDIKKYLADRGYYPVDIPFAELDYFNNSFCKQLYHPVMNSDVNMSMLTTLTDYEQTFRGISKRFYDSMTIGQGVVYISDYRLLYLCTLITQHQPKVPIAFFYNRMFPHIQTLKLIPFYKALLTNFLLPNVIQFSNHDTCNQFLQILKDQFQIEYNSVRGNLSFQYYGREVSIRLYNPGIQCQVCEVVGTIEELNGEILIVGVDNYGHQSGLDLKLRLLFEYIKEHKPRNVKFIQLILPATGDDNYDISSLQAIVKDINDYMYPQGNDYFAKLLINANRFAYLKRADIYLQTRFSGRHDYYLLEYVHINIQPHSLVSDSSCYHKGLQTVQSFNCFSYKDFSAGLSRMLDQLQTKQYHERTVHQIKVNHDHELVRKHQTAAWLENLYLETKKNSQMTEFAKISLIKSNSQVIKIAHNFRYKPCNLEKIRSNWAQAKRKLLVINFDSLVFQGRFIEKPRRIITKNQSEIEIRQLDQKIEHALKQCKDMYIISDGPFNELNFHPSFAEGGYLFNCDTEWQPLFDIDFQCMDQLEQIFNQYTQKIEGSRTVISESRIYWSVDYDTIQIADLVQSIQGIIDRYPQLQLIHKGRHLEVCPSNLNKGIIMEMILQKELCNKGKLDFFMVLGRGIYDESVFSHLKSIQNSKTYFNESCSIYSISNTLTPTYASYYLENEAQLLQLLQILV